MTNTMANEILSMNELDRVSGGTWKEYYEIANLLPKIPEKWQDVKGTTYDGFRFMTPEEVQKWLNEKLNIWAVIDTGSKWNPNPRAGEKNTYNKFGKSLTHSKVIAEIHNFLGK